uniref:Sorting nexin-29 n=1 Tax=Anopheles farauti TaxID=69004 RepID=A0A182Q814_9DIPT
MRAMVGMSNFVLNTSTLENIVGGNRGTNGGDQQEQRRDQERVALVDELLATTRDCQKQYGNNTKLATEDDPLIGTLCDVWERVLTHGLRTASWTAFNVLDYFGPADARPSSEQSCFWDFAFHHLTRDERERFGGLRHVVNRHGRARALLRAFLNERALERYVQMWLGDEQLLEQHYEPWAMVRQGEVQSLLPSVAAGLGTILFAIVIDRPELNRSLAVRRAVEPKPEPIIATRRPVGPVRKVNAVQREILEDVPRQRTPLANSTPAQPIHDIGALASTECIPRPQSLIPTVPIATEALLAEVKPPSQERDYDADKSVLNYSSTSVNTTAINTTSTTTNTTSSTSTAGSEEEEGQSGEVDAEVTYRSGSDFQSNTTRSGSFVESEPDLAPDPTCDDHIPRAVYDKLMRRHQDLEERWHQLESRVAVLSLENYRLRMLTRSNRLSVAFFSFSIPKAIQRTADGGRSRRPYHVYEIRVTPSGVSGSTTGNESWCVYRRYNEFYRLHRRLQKQYPTVKTLDFPPKKKFGNMNADFVEQRRQRLQVYLNGLFVTTLPEVLSCSTRIQLEETFPFLADQLPVAGAT